MWENFTTSSCRTFPVNHHRLLLFLRLFDEMCDFLGPSEFYVQPFLHGPYLEMISFCMQLFYSLMDENDLHLSFDNVVRCPDYTQIWCAAPYQETDSNGNNRWNYFRARLLRRLSPSIFQVRSHFIIIDRFFLSHLSKCASF